MIFVDQSEPEPDDDRMPLEECLHRLEPGSALELHEGGCPAGSEGQDCECASWIILRRERRS